MKLSPLDPTSSVQKINWGLYSFGEFAGNVDDLNETYVQIHNKMCENDHQSNPSRFKYVN